VTDLEADEWASRMAGNEPKYPLSGDPPEMIASLLSDRLADISWRLDVHERERSERARPVPYVPAPSRAAHL
jgi:hypothetical protein